MNRYINIGSAIGILGDPWLLANGHGCSGGWRGVGVCGLVCRLLGAVNFMLSRRSNSWANEKIARQTKRDRGEEPLRNQSRRG